MVTYDVPALGEPLTTTPEAVPLASVVLVYGDADWEIHVVVV